jgi:hypothetical protein
MDKLDDQLKAAKAAQAIAAEELTALRDARTKLHAALGETDTQYREQYLDVLKMYIEGSEELPDIESLVELRFEHSALTDSLTYLDSFLLPDAEIELTDAEIGTATAETDALECEAREQIEKMRTASAAAAAANPGVVMNIQGSEAQLKLDEVARLQIELTNRKGELQRRRKDTDLAKQRVLSAGFLAPRGGRL